MKIVFGSRKPNEKESALLLKLGFDLNKLENKGRYYYLEVPSEKLKVKTNNPAFDLSITTISYNGVEVISINQKTAIYDSYVYFNINEKAILEALSKPEMEEEKQVKLSSFQQKLADRIRQIEFIVFEDGADRGYGKMLSAQLPYLQALRKENPEEHDQLISSNERYKKLFEMFPDWTDKNNLQPKYEARDVGIFAIMAHHSAQNSEDGKPECSIM